MVSKSTPPACRASTWSEMRRLQAGSEDEFQSTPPRGVSDPIGAWEPVSDGAVSITPACGRHPPGGIHMITQSWFQSTPPAWRAISTQAACFLIRASQVSIHAPAWEATPGMLRLASVSAVASIVSIHAPAWAGDVETSSQMTPRPISISVSIPRPRVGGATCVAPTAGSL